MKYVLLGFVGLLVWSCDKAPTKPFHDLSGYVGTYSGTYRELGCGDPPFEEYTHDSVLADVSILTEDVLAIKLSIAQGADLWDLEAFYIDDSTFYITPFSKDQMTWSGNLMITDQLRLILANRTIPCVIGADTLGTVLYVGKR